MQHAAKVRAIQAQVRAFAKRRQRVKIYHGSTNSTRLTTFEAGSYVDVSDLGEVLELNPSLRTVTVEPNVPMDQLVEATLRVDLLPPVVPEFPGITVGGAIQGGAEESSSFREGLVHDTALAYEIVLGNGDVVMATRSKHADLFWGIAASYGSLGIITAVTLRLVPAKPYVRFTYERTASSQDTLRSLKRLASDPSASFLDAILFAPDVGVVMSGRLSDTQPLPIASFHRATDEWFYLHAEQRARQHEKFEELVPIRDYLFRYDRGAFWMGKHGLARLPIPFNRVTRFLFDWIARTRACHRFIQATGIMQQYIIQDFNLPLKTAHDFLSELDRTVGIYPLWLCPLRPGDPRGWSANALRANLVINVGVWGSAPRDFSEFVRTNRALEQMTTRLGGRTMLYAQAYYPEAEFWQLYDRTGYERLRRTYQATVIFPTLYEKTHVQQRYAASIPRGIWRVLREKFGTLVQLRS